MSLQEQSISIAIIVQIILVIFLYIIITDIIIPYYDTYINFDFLLFRSTTITIQLAIRIMLKLPLI